VADVVWMSPAFVQRYGDATPYPQAPELCVGILSPASTPAELHEKIRLYLGYGAQEVWPVAADGRMALFGAEGERERSALPGVGVVDQL
jgi:Uma2 family endonuclease